MKNTLPNLRKTIALPGCGHYVQQEREDIVNVELINFLDEEISKR